MLLRAALWCLAASLPAWAWAFVPRPSGAAHGIAAYLDLDLALPPGTPLDWSRSVPHTPVERAPTTPAGGSAATVNGNAPTSSSGAVAEITRVAPSNFGLLRILTWDLTAHVGWLGEVDRPLHTITRGGGELAYPPVVRRPFWWMTMAPLLRLLLHPQYVSAAETEAHLLELGEAVIPALEAARSEPALAGLCDELLRQIGRPASVPPTPLRGSNADERMWLRFVAEQLTERHPHDPELGFGERLYLFGERVVPHVAAYLLHDHAFLRRNAVVALEHLGGRAALDALLGTLSTTKDPVQWCRAVLALGRHRYAAAREPFQAWLIEEATPWRAAVLMHALGLIGDPRAVEAIVKRASVRKVDADLMMSALVALARLPQREAPEALTTFLNALRRESPLRWRREPPPPAYVPDRPDTSDARFDLLLQLERIARSAAAPADPESSAVLLAWLRRGDEERSPQPWLGQEPATGTLAAVAAPARLVYLDQLARLGSSGREALTRVVRDANLDPQLRAHALRYLPVETRAELAKSYASNRSIEGLLRVAALENLLSLRSAELIDVACDVLEEVLAEADLDELSSAQRYLTRRAVDIVASFGAGSERGSRLLLQLAERRPRPAEPSQRIEDALRDQIAAMVGLVAEKRSIRAAARMIDDVLDIVIQKHLSPIVRAETRDAARTRLVALLEGARVSRDAKYLETVVDTILSELLGRVIGANQAELQFAPRVPLGDALCFALARVRDAAALRTLLRRAGDAADPERGSAVLAAGLIPSRIVLAHLFAALEDRDAFVRLCAAAALEKRTGARNTCDWLLGDRAALKAGVDAWRALVEK